MNLNLKMYDLKLCRLPPEPKEEKAEGKPVSQLRFRIPATHTRDSDETSNDASANVTNGETKNGEFFLTLELLEILNLDSTFFKASKHLGLNLSFFKYI